MRAHPSRQDIDDLPRAHENSEASESQETPKHLHVDKFRYMRERRYIRKV